MSDLSLRYRIEFQCTPNAQPTDSNSLGRREASNVATSLAGHIWSMLTPLLWLRRLIEVGG